MMESIMNEIPTFYPITDQSDFLQLRDYRIENITNTEAEAGKVLHIFLVCETSEGENKYRELMIMDDGRKYLTEEY